MLQVVNFGDLPVVYPFSLSGAFGRSTLPNIRRGSAGHVPICHQRHITASLESNLRAPFANDSFPIAAQVIDHECGIGQASDVAAQIATCCELHVVAFHLFTLKVDRPPADTWIRVWTLRTCASEPA